MPCTWGTSKGLPLWGKIWVVVLPIITSGLEGRKSLKEVSIEDLLEVRKRQRSH